MMAGIGVGRATTNSSENANMQLKRILEEHQHSSLNTILDKTEEWSLGNAKTEDLYFVIQIKHRGCTPP